MYLQLLMVCGQSFGCNGGQYAGPGYYTPPPQVQTFYTPAPQFGYYSPSSWAAPSFQASAYRRGGFFPHRERFASFPFNGGGFQPFYAPQFQSFGALSGRGY